MIKKITALTAAATLAAAALVGVAAPAQAASKTIYTNCIDMATGQKLAKKNLARTTYLYCTDLEDLSALKGATKLKGIDLLGQKKLKVTGTSKLSKLGITTLQMENPVTDPTFAFVKDFPKLTTLNTGPTNVSNLSNIAKLKQLRILGISTNKPMSFAKLASKKKLTGLGLDIGTTKADFTSITALPALLWLSLGGSVNQPLTTLTKSKTLTYVSIDRTFQKKLAKGQSYKAPSTVTKKYGVLDVNYSMGGISKADDSGAVKSTGTGMAFLTGGTTTKLGRLDVSNSVRIKVTTSGKMNFYRPVVSAKSIRAGQVVTAKKSSANGPSGWNLSTSKCSYQWQRNTKDIKGATKLTYKAATADVGKTLRLKTTCYPSTAAKNAYGFTSNTKYSGAVKVSR